MPSPAKYQWIRHCRGLTPSERSVLRFLVDEANGDGYIDRLNVRTIAYSCELSRRRVFEILGSLERDKGFVKSRTPRVGMSRVRVSNAYQLDLERRHPPDVGDRHAEHRGKLLFRLISDELRTPAHMLEDSDAYHSKDRGVLTCWLISSPAAQFFASRSAEIQTFVRQWESRLRFTPPNGFEYIHPTGAWSTAKPRDRRRKAFQEGRAAAP